MGWLSDWKLPDGAADTRRMQAVQLTGDPAAFAQLMHRWQGPIRRLCVRMSGDEHLGEDLAQETFVRVFASRQTFLPERRFSTWLWRIAINVCGEAVRKKRAMPMRFEVADYKSPHERAATNENALRVQTALAQLDENQRAVVVLREYENLKFREIADVLGVPEGTVKWRMSEAMKTLSQLLPVE